MAGFIIMIECVHVVVGQEEFEGKRFIVHLCLMGDKWNA